MGYKMVACSYNEILLNDRNEQVTDTCNTNLKKYASERSHCLGAEVVLAGKRNEEKLLEK